MLQVLLAAWFYVAIALLRSAPRAPLCCQHLRGGDHVVRWDLIVVRVAVHL